MEKYFRKLSGLDYNPACLPLSDFEKNQINKICSKFKIAFAKYWNEWDFPISAVGVYYYISADCRYPGGLKDETLHILFPVKITRNHITGVKIKWLTLEVMKEPEDYYTVCQSYEPKTPGTTQYYKCDDLLGLIKFLEFIIQEIKNIF